MAAPLPEFNISRSFDAPREAVWKAWTDRDEMMQWWGPKGCTITEAKLDLKPGGVFHYCMLFMGVAMWGKFVFKEIKAPEKLLFTSSFSDKDGNVTRHPFSADWPLETSTTITFTEKQGKTTVSVKWLPLNPTEIELKTFAAGMDSMQQGWTGTMERLETYLAG